MSLKNKVGNYLILFGLIALLVFVASVLAPPESFDSTAFLAGAGLLVVGVAFRRSKVRPRAGGPPAAGGGAGGGGAPPPGPLPRPKPARQGLFSTLLNGPASKQKTAPGGGGGKGGGGKGGPPGKGGGGGGKGGPPGKGGGGGGGGKPRK